MATPWTAAHQASLSLTISQSLPSSCPLSRGCHPTITASVTPFSFCLQSFPASGSFPMSQLFTSSGQSVGASASACLSNEFSGLISFRMDFPLGGTLKSLLKHHSSKASILWRSAFFMVQLSCPYMTTHPGPPLRGPESWSSCLFPPHAQLLGV